MPETPVSRAAAVLAADRQEVRFAVVGVLNTALSLAVFALLYELFGTVLHYMGALVLSYLIGLCTGFAAHRRSVFRVRGRLWGDFVRFTTVNVGGLALNAALLPFLVEVVSIPPVLAQVTAMGFIVLATYFGHALFSFRRS